MKSIEVKVTKYKDRRFWIMYYDDPVTGKRVPRSTKQTAERAAEREAAKWEAELQKGTYRPASAITWVDFRERYEREVAAGLAGRTALIVATAFNSFESVVRVDRLRDVTHARLSHYQSVLRERGKSIATIRTYLAHLNAAFAWAVKDKLMLSAPEVTMPKQAKGAKLMKGRPITTEEFERMLGKIAAGLQLAVKERRGKPVERKRKRSEEAIAGDQKRKDEHAAAAVPSWHRLLQGLWLSGLRLGEALNLSWDDETKILVDFTGRRPMFLILAELEKGGQDRILPMTPDFAEFLQATPESERVGPVFPIVGRGESGPVRLEWACNVIACIGKAAGVLVDKKSQKFASAHDLRRSFGERWSKRVMPATLQQMMRHADISTTMRYYVGQNADAAADTIWEAAGRVNTFVNSAENQADQSNKPASARAAEQRT